MTQRLSTSIASLARGPILVLSMFNCGFAAAQQPLAQRVQRIDACFQEAIRARAVDEPVLSRVRSSDEAVFLSERLARDISYDDKLNGWRGQAIDEAPEDYCKRAASDFVKAVLKALEGQPADGLAQMGTLSIASESTVVESYQNLIGRHHRGLRHQSSCHASEALGAPGPESLRVCISIA